MTPTECYEKSTLVENALKRFEESNIFFSQVVLSCWGQLLNMERAISVVVVIVEIMHARTIFFDTTHNEE